MITMVDEIYDRHYRAARGDLNAAIVEGAARLARAVTNAFNVLNRIEYSAPWAITRKGVRSH